MALKVYNPPSPYLGEIRNGLQNGMLLQISGMPTGGESRFDINLICGRNKENGNAFHFNPKFDQNEVVLNTYQNGSWGNEEKQGHFPFRKDCNFEMIIGVQHTCFRVTINGHQFCYYNHRLPLNTITHIETSTGLRLNYILVYIRNWNTLEIETKEYSCFVFYSRKQYTDADERALIGAVSSGYLLFASAAYVELGWLWFPVPRGYPSAEDLAPVFNHPFPVPGGYPSAEDLAPVFNHPPSPFKHRIGSLYPNRLICISGIPKPNAHRFTFNFRCEPDIAFNFDVRFSENAIVRNTCRQGTWGGEERGVPCFPFKHDLLFEIIILVDSTCFKVVVNNQHFIEYNHRIQSLQCIDTLEITGDVKIVQVRFK